MERRAEKSSQQRSHLMAHPVSNYERISQTTEFKSMTLKQQDVVANLERLRLREANRIVEAIERRHGA